MTGETKTSFDRAAAVRRALCSLVARKGFHGASMSAVAAEAEVATGTAYVHYASKDDLVIATYLEVKRNLGDAAVEEIDPSAPPAERFVRMWSGIYRHLVSRPDQAKFLVQVDGSPYAELAHQRALETSDDPLMAEATRPDMHQLLAPFPPAVLYELGIGPAVRMAASGAELSEEEAGSVARACWRAISRGD